MRIFLALLLTALVASAQDRPTILRGGVLVEMSDAEYEQWTNNQANAAIAASNEAARATLPLTSETGFATLNASNHWVELVPVDNDVIPVQVSNSPLDPATRQAMKAAALAEYQQTGTTIRQDLRSIRTNLVAVIDLTNTNIEDAQAIKASTTNQTAGAQAAQISALADELVDTNRRLKNTQQELQRLRKAFAQYLKENEQ